MDDELQRVQAAVADLARAGAALDDVKANVRALAFDRRDSVEARRVLQDGVERVLFRLKVVGL